LRDLVGEGGDVALQGFQGAGQPLEIRQQGAQFGGGGGEFGQGVFDRRIHVYDFGVLVTVWEGKTDE
jgi:hypothetical protein